MSFLISTSPGTKVFVPNTVAQVTTTGNEAWRTNQRTPPPYGILGTTSRAMAPTNMGTSQLFKYGLMQGNPAALPYKLSMLGVTPNG